MTTGFSSCKLSTTRWRPPRSSLLAFGSRESKTGEIHREWLAAWQTRSIWQGRHFTTDSCPNIQNADGHASSRCKGKLLRSSRAKKEILQRRDGGLLGVGLPKDVRHDRRRPPRDSSLLRKNWPSSTNVQRTDYPLGASRTSGKVIDPVLCACRVPSCAFGSLFCPTFQK
jgi:hypothetical protein